MIGLIILLPRRRPPSGERTMQQREFPEGHARNKLNYIAGDMHSSLITTARGRTILVQHDTTTPRPYSRLNLIQGTNGAFAGFPDRIAHWKTIHWRQTLKMGFTAGIMIWKNGVNAL